MKNILVTGGSGFIGSNFIINQLKTTDNKIFNLDKLTYASNIDNIKKAGDLKNYTFSEGDINDYVLVNNIFDNFKPDLIINFAAESHVDRSIESPDIFITTNILGTLNLLKVSLKYYLDKDDFKFIHISTDEVYGSLNSDQEAFKETSQYKPNSPYSASKASSDHLVRSWNKTYGLPAIITNCSNNYGFYQFPEKLIPLTIINCIDEKNIPIYGKGENLRDWIHVNDHCNAINLIINSSQTGEVFNIGASNEIRNIDLVHKICSILDSVKPRSNNESYMNLINFVQDRPGHDFRYAINSSKINNILGWSAQINIDQGLEQTIKWYLKNESWWRKIQSKGYKQERLGLNKT
tara:strand:- start:9 stop:1058 length:1050 start_codon:yes stop_codon:yes gene_type:complete